MFDIGFLEIFVILIVALIVIGPERMPEVARKIGSFTGKTKRFIQNMKQDSQLEDTVRELKESIDMQEEKRRLDEISESLNTNFHDIRHDIDVSEFQRPSFGNEGDDHDFGQPSNSTNQYNKAPKQPVMPSKPTESTQTASSTTNTSTTPAKGETSPPIQSPATAEVATKESKHA